MIRFVERILILAVSASTIPTMGSCSTQTSSMGPTMVERASIKLGSKLDIDPASGLIRGVVPNSENCVNTSTAAITNLDPASARTAVGVFEGARTDGQIIDPTAGSPDCPGVYIPGASDTGTRTLEARPATGPINTSIFWWRYLRGPWPVETGDTIVVAPQSISAPSTQIPGASVLIVRGAPATAATPRVDWVFLLKSAPVDSVTGISVWSRSDPSVAIDDKTRNAAGHDDRAIKVTITVTGKVLISAAVDLATLNGTSDAWLIGWVNAAKATVGHE